MYPLKRMIFHSFLFVDQRVTSPDRGRLMVSGSTSSNVDGRWVARGHTGTKVIDGDVVQYGLGLSTTMAWESWGMELGVGVFLGEWYQYRRTEPSFNAWFYQPSKNGDILIRLGYKFGIASSNEHSYGINGPRFFLNFGEASDSRVHNWVSFPHCLRSCSIEMIGKLWMDLGKE